MAETGSNLTAAATGTQRKPKRLPLLRQRGARVVEDFRRSVEAEVIALAGEIRISAASRIHTASVSLRRWLAVEKLLRDGGDTLDLADKLALMDRSVKFKSEVDRSLAALGLDAKVAPRDPWADIYAPQLPAIPGDEAPSNPDTLPVHNPDAPTGQPDGLAGEAT